MADPGKKVLVFEDNKSIQTLLAFFFKKRGMEARVLPDGTGAVAACREFAPDVILMDCIMPGKDGLEATMDLRQAGIRTPVVMLTSKSHPTDRELAASAGVDSYLVKPFNPAQLEAALRPYLGG